MDELIPNSIISKELVTKVITWLEINVFTITSLTQLGVLLGLILIAWWLSVITAKWVEAVVQRKKRRFYIRIHATYKEVFFLLYVTLFSWGAVVVAQNFELHFQVLKTLSSLFVAWAVIRVLSSVINSDFWSQFIAFTVWIVAALHIVGWLEHTIEMLDQASIMLGSFKLSLLLIVKALLAFGILLWGVSALSHLLERLFHRSTSLTPSQQVLFYKLTNLTLYTLAIIFGLNLIGLDLTAFTVFSGALGLGIGFGLQKVFSNFISGIILLMDKSIKPGDVIVVNDRFGWVNSLGARYVSIITRDGKEHLIPNENLITEQVENWSYTDKKVRVKIPVGVSYKADIKLAKELMLQVIKEHPRVLKYPEPVCLITGFGDSSVEHQLRIWIEDPVNGVSNVISDIYYGIWDAFKENNVEIPFPQRDLHIKSMDGMSGMQLNNRPVFD